MKLVAVLLILLVLIAIFMLAFMLVTKGAQAFKRAKWKTHPMSLPGDRTQMYLVRGKNERIKIGEPFASTDDMALDERLLDAARMKRSMEK